MLMYWGTFDRHRTASPTHIRKLCYRLSPFNNKLADQEVICGQQIIPLGYHMNVYTKRILVQLE